MNSADAMKQHVVDKVTSAKACASDGAAGAKEHSANTERRNWALETPVSHPDVMLSVADQYVDTFLPDNEKDTAACS